MRLLAPRFPAAMILLSVVSPATSQVAQFEPAPAPLVLSASLPGDSLLRRSAPFMLAGGDTPSRDELFGDEQPASRDDLFGRAEATSRGPRISGFVDELAGYSYNGPGHWSRGVTRLQLVAQGEFAAGIKWKASGRVDADPVYFLSNVYPDPVKRDQRVDFFYRENYLDFSAGGWDYRLGAQQIVWGEVIGLFFADVVSARDLREFLLPDFDIIRIPQWAARAEYTAHDAHVELVWIPVPTFDRIGKPGSEFYPVPLPLPLPQDLASLFKDPERPGRSLNNSNYGIRANTLVSGWDLSAFYYRSFSTSPTFYRVPGDGPAQPFVFQPRYDRIWQVGGTLGKDLGPAVLRAEGVYTHGQNFTVADITASPSEVERQTLDWIASLEWAFPRDTRVNVQMFERRYFGGSAGALAIPNDGIGGSLFASTKLSNTLEPQILWVRNLRDGGGLIRPRLNWTAARNVLVSFGVDIFTGPVNSYFGRYNDRDRVYAEVRLDF